MQDHFPIDLKRGELPEAGSAELERTLVDGNGELFGRLRRTNLNLLPILAAVLETGRVGEAARRLNLTQPAVSQALRQLRTIFDDDLVVMSGRVPMLTARALRLQAPLRKLLAATDHILAEARPFDPDTEALTARIVTADYIGALLTPHLLRRCANHGVGHRIDFVGIDIKRMQDLSQVDMVILPRPLAQRLGKTNGAMPVFEDRYVCIAAPESPLPSSLPPEQIRLLPQLQFSLDAHFPPNSHHLLTAAADLESTNGWSFESYTVLALTISRSDRIGIVPEMLARWVAALAPLRIIEIEGPARTHAIDAIWGAEFEGRQDHRWLRTIIGEAARCAFENVHHGQPVAGNG